MKRRNGDWGSRCGSLVFPRRLELIKLKHKALRRGVWYRVLSRIERSLVELAIATVNRIRSWVLARSLASVVKKLAGIIETSVHRRIQTVGLPLAKRFSRIAQNWGNKSAANWAIDPGFARFLAICTANTSS